jgi:hypothetical protein
MSTGKRGRRGDPRTFVSLINQTPKGCGIPSRFGHVPRKLQRKLCPASSLPMITHPRAFPNRRGSRNPTPVCLTRGSMLSVIDVTH